MVKQEQNGNVAAIYVDIKPVLIIPIYICNELFCYQGQIYTAAAAKTWYALELPWNYHYDTHSALVILLQNLS
jgi:hypothetical protein